MAAETVTFEIDGRRVRDLNGNGELDPYEDPRRAARGAGRRPARAMTLEEKAGLMFHPPIGIGAGGRAARRAVDCFGGDGTTRLVAERHLNHFNIYFDARRARRPPSGTTGCSGSPRRPGSASR